MRPARPELWIVLGVLVPFAVLVAVGLLWTAPETPPRPPSSLGDADDAGPAPDRALELAPAVGASTAPDRGHLGDAGPEAPGATAPFPPELAAPLEAVRAELHRCLVDQDTRAPAHVEVHVSFRPTPTGGFEGVRVRPSWQDPYLEACVEDVFAEVHWAPSGRETFAPASYTFRLER